ncbi:MAG: hypothetical protein V3V20_11035 [Algisphaera sp.]
MHKTILTTAVIATLLTTACTTPAKRLDTNTRQRIVTTSGLDVDDAIRAADVLTESMLNSRVFNGAGESIDGKPPLIEVSTFINNTETQIDPDSVLKKIRIELTNSGLARVFTPRGHDAIAAEQSARDQFRNDASNTGRPTVLRPDYTLSFKIIDDRAKAGRIHELTYTFQMSLTEANTRIAAWEGEEIISKQGSKSTVGW